MRKFTSWAALVLTAALMYPGVASGVTIGQTDNFEDGTTQNWVINLLGMGSPPFPPVNVPTGGPAGAGDNYLQLTATGIANTAGSRLSVIQFQNQWAGNYIAAGITAIAMDVKNFGNTDLYLRVLFADPTIGPPTNEAFSTAPMLLPVGSGWRSVLFPIDTPFLTADTGTVLAALSNSTEFRIFSGTSALADPTVPSVAAVLGVDNITAAAIPEPATFVLLGAGLTAILAGASRRRAS